METENLAFILRQCLEGGNNTHWEAFIRLVQPVIAEAVLRTLSRSGSFQREAADDLIQTVFLKIWEDNSRVLRNFRGSDSPSLRAYLRVISVSTVLDWFRSQPRESAMDPDIVTGLEAHD